jgi:hypothetical protein
MASRHNNHRRSTGAVRRAASAALAASCCLLPLLGGCRAVDNAQVDVLESELRKQEDYIYELENYLSEYSEKLRECRSCQELEISSSPAGAPTPAESSHPRSTLRSGVQRPGSIQPVDPIPATQSPGAAAPATSPPASEPSPRRPAAEPAAPSVDPEDFAPPQLDIGPTSDLQWQEAAPIATTPSPSTKGGDEAPPYIPDPADYQIDVEPDADDAAGTSAAAQGSSPTEEPTLAEPSLQPPLVAEPSLPPPADDASRLVAQRLEIRHVYRESAAPDVGKPAALLVVVEALNATDEPVDSNGKVSLMVAVGETPESLTTIDRWDFTPEETRAAWQSSQLGDGLHLELPLKETALPEGQLGLWVRLVGADGAKLMTRLPFEANQLTSMASAEAAEPSAHSAGSTPLASLDALGEKTPKVDTPAAPAPAPEPLTQWRASAAALEASRTGSLASTTDHQGGGWTRHSPAAGDPLPMAPRAAAGQGGQPRWQQGASAEGPQGDTANAWAPVR